MIWSFQGIWRAGLLQVQDPGDCSSIANDGSGQLYSGISCAAAGASAALRLEQTMQLSEEQHEQHP